jgi:hypothetical protein
MEGDPGANFCCMARHLMEALESEMQATQERVNMLRDMLGQ